MNSLNILSARVSPPQTPAPSRTNSYGNALSLAGATEVRRGSRADVNNEKVVDEDNLVENPPSNDGTHNDAAEETPLLEKSQAIPTDAKLSARNMLPNRIASAIINSLRWVVSTLSAPGVHLIAYLYDERGQFAPFYQLRKLWPRRNTGQLSTQALGTLSSDERVPLLGNRNEKDIPGRRSSVKATRRLPMSRSSSSGLSSESESERDRLSNEAEDEDSTSPARHTRSKSLQSSEEITPTRRSIRIKLNADDSLRQRKHRKAQSTNSRNNSAGTVPTSDISPATLKSPTSPGASLSMTKYPRAPAPPRPLIPRRQPSYTLSDASNGKLAQKTLILDLDETLIHSMAKGGRMSTGHMVEVKLNTYIGVAGQASIGPQHPILYYVHKRPHCDDFLRRVCKWYNLVVFTASVQEYADPVIDWLEQERKFFSGRFYRQHCTYRNGAFIKDLSSVEPDLSKVMILDNSPLSYMFHQDNAIPIEGWINDPTDNDLLHLVPLLEGLQYVTDVRALLALRGGEDGKHVVA